MNKKQLSIIVNDLGIQPNQVINTIKLLEEGATIPFIARYRKEVTGSLDEVAIGDISKLKKRLEEIEKRKETILKSIEEQGKLTDALHKRIADCYELNVLEDIYLPYKRKRKTRASMARAKGLGPLADSLLKQDNQQLEKLVASFINEEVPNMDEALQGARDIIAEMINEDEKARNKVRYLFKKGAVVKTKLVRGKEEEGKKYSDYFDFDEDLKKCPSHRYLAVRRGEEEGILRLNISPDKEESLDELNRMYVHGHGEASRQVSMAIEEGYKRLLSPSIETEFRNSSKEKADLEAIHVFAENLKQLLLSAPLGQKRVLAIDPGFRTGCKVCCLGTTGDLLHHDVIYPHPPQNQGTRSVMHIKHLVHDYEIDAIAIGNGTAGRETLALFSSADLGRPVEVFMVNESGASIYSASEIAREEFPDHDITVRGAVSIGRRLIDPLAELVKIDPKSIGVGQYQHDVHQGQLKESLERVVESCVNSVGININTASKHLLTHVSGLGPTLAQNILDYRTEIGEFKSRKALKKVPRMGAKAFEQCAGFLRIKDSKNPLDNTAVHPESYTVVEQMAGDLGCTVTDLIARADLRKAIDLKKYVTEQTGLPTLRDIVKELQKPGLDPRGSAQPVEFAKGIHSIEDLNEGIVVPGIVTNITNFGCFVDIGIKQDGLVHISELANKFVKNPADVVHVQQQVKVKVIQVDRSRNRIMLSMKQA